MSIDGDHPPRSYLGATAAGNRHLADLLEAWRDEIRDWRIPDEIRRRAEDEPPLARRVPDASGPPPLPTGSLSFAREWEALEAPGSVLDVGAGTGDASLALTGRVTHITAVDTSLEQLDMLERRARFLGVPVRTVCGSWPDVGHNIAASDVVVCHYVLYEVEDIGPFVDALTAHARRRVVLTIPLQHPQAAFTPLWEHFYGLRRPNGPIADNALEILRAMGLDPRMEVWVDVDGFGGYSSFDELVDRTRRRLYLPPQRSGEVANQLLGLGVDPAQPTSLGTVGRKVATLWWQGTG